MMLPDALKKLIKIAQATVFPTTLVTSRRRFVLIYMVRLLFLVARRLWNDRAPRQAAALAYQTVLSLVPTLFVFIAIASALGMNRYLEAAIPHIESYLVPQAATKVITYMEQMASTISPGTLGAVGATVFLGISLTLFFSIEQTVNDIFRCQRNRKLHIRLLFVISFILTMPTALAASLYYSARLFLTGTSILTVIMPLVLTVAVLFLCYWLIPHTKVKKRHAFTAAIITGFAVDIFKWGFTLYATHLGGTLSYVYDTLAILPLFMFWIYLIWLVFLFGTELTAALHEVSHHHRLEKDIPTGMIPAMKP